MPPASSSADWPPPGTRHVACLRAAGRAAGRGDLAAAGADPSAPGAGAGEASSLAASAAAAHRRDVPAGTSGAAITRPSTPAASAATLRRPAAAALSSAPPSFAYNEALRLARAVGVDLDTGVVGRIAGKKGSNLHLWDSARRAAAGALGPADGSRGMIDALHHAAYAARERSLAAGAELLAPTGLDAEPRFFAALEAVLETLPPSRTFTGVALEGARGVRRRFRGALQPVPLRLSRPDRRARSVASVAGRELTNACRAQVEAEVHA